MDAHQIMMQGFIIDGLQRLKDVAWENELVIAEEIESVIAGAVLPEGAEEIAA